MKKIEAKKLVTVGELLKGLKKYEKKRSDYVVNINIPDGSTLNIVSTILERCSFLVPKQEKNKKKFASVPLDRLRSADKTESADNSAPRT